MFDVPLGTKTGYWDTAEGVPKQNGDIDYNSYEARNCWVYGPHQWLNQGCVAISDDDESIGTPLNKKGGGVFGKIFDASFIAIAYRWNEHSSNILLTFYFSTSYGMGSCKPIDEIMGFCTTC